MLRRFIVSFSFAYLLVAFSFILLTLLNASDQGQVIVVGESDASLVVTLSFIGLLVTMTLAIRVLIDGKRRRDLEQHVRVPRRRSDVMSTDM